MKQSGLLTSKSEIKQSYRGLWSNPFPYYWPKCFRIGMLWEGSTKGTSLMLPPMVFQIGQLWRMLTKAVQSENTLASLKSAFFQRTGPRGLRIMNCLVKLNLVTALIKRILLRPQHNILHESEAQSLQTGLIIFIIL